MNLKMAEGLPHETHENKGATRSRQAHRNFTLTVTKRVFAMPSLFVCFVCWVGTN